MYDSKITELAKNGENLKGLGIIDVHCHLGPFPVMNMYGNDIRSMVDMMDYVGVDKAMISTMTGVHSDIIYGNNYVHDAHDKFPERAFGYVFVNPNYSYGLAEEIERCMKLGGFRGVKVYTSSGYPYDGPKYNECWETAMKYDLPILAHTWGGDVVRALEKVAKNFPKLKVILGHSGAEDFYVNIDVVKNTENVFLDLTLSKSPYGLVEKFVEEVGSERVVFGSDLPMIALTHQIGKVLYAKISDGDKENILSKNAKRIFGF